MPQHFDDLVDSAHRFYKRQCADLNALGIHVLGLPLSQFAFRTKTFREYLAMRDVIEAHSTANRENVWNGRPISKLLLKDPLNMGDGAQLDIIELIPPFHQRVYPMGFEHIGYVVGENVEAFGREHRDVLTGQQFQSADCEPYYVRFDDYTHAKFYRYSLMEVCRREGAVFDSFLHADWHPEDLEAGPYPELPRTG